MIVVGIPTYNESENIKNLVEKIDMAASELKIDILIVNSDNYSEDKTYAIFRNINTKNLKVSLCTLNKGKGYNIKKILEYASKLSECKGVVFIDGDVKSFSREWLKEMYHNINYGVDFIIPNYARSFQEGNTTNHFIYPLLYYHTKGNCPFQAISGDFGLSKRFVNYLINEVEWNKYSFGYGVDIFLSINALFNNFYVKEINLDRKIHNPSFDKMENMFFEVACSYCETYKMVLDENRNLEIHFEASEKNRKLCNPRKYLLPEILIERKHEIINLINTKSYINCNLNITAKKWISILLEHEAMIGRVDSDLIVKSLSPYFLLRVYDYLLKSNTMEKAIIDLDKEIYILKTFIR